LLLSLKALAADYHSIKLSFEAVGFPAIHRIFFVKNKATPLNGQYVIAKALYPLLLHVSM
jgi:hypothetical protein